MFKIFLRNGELNDATAYYISIIKKSLNDLEYEVSVTSDINSIKKTDKIITISARSFFNIWIRNRKQYIAHWFQGITPEEAKMTFESSWSKYPRVIINTIWEKIILTNARFVFFVSQSMKEHYEIKYKYNKKNYFIMPCFNQKLNTDSFRYENKYINMSFVYAGSLSKWQCIEETLRIFKSIQTLIPEAYLHLYTSEEERAEKFFRKYKLNNVSASYVPYEKLNNELQKFKYGFLIRDNTKVNNVATPTKMNTYLANGVIPIFYDVVDDFRQNLSYDYLIYAEHNNEDKLIEKILDNHNKPILIESIQKDFQSIFDKYYCESMYIEQLQERIRKYI